MIHVTQCASHIIKIRLQRLMIAAAAVNNIRSHLHVLC